MQVAWDQAAPGITEAFRTMLANPYAQGQRAQIDAETAIAKALWGIEQDKAQIAAARARAAEDQAKTAILTGRPALVNERMALQAGRTPQQITQFRDSFNAGSPGAPYAQGAQTAISRALIENLPLLGAETWNPDQIAKATGEYADINRAADALGNPAAIANLQQLEFARKGNPRYGVQGNTVVDQLLGVGDPTAVGRSMINENTQQAAAAATRAAGADKFTIKEGEDDQGNPTFVRIPMQGPAGVVDTGAKPRPRRDPAELQGNAEYKAAYPFGATANDPSQAEFLAMKKAGKDPVVEFTKILQDARRAIKAGKDPAAVRQRLQQFGINPARLDAQ